MLRKTQFVCGAFFVFLLFVGPSAHCAWKDDWEKVLQAAEKEGQVNVYIYQFEPALEVFKKTFPEIKVVAVTGTGNQMGNRIIAERRAGKYFADVFSGGVSTNFNVLHLAKALAPIRPMLILPEVLDESRWYGRRHFYSDPEGQYIFAYVANAYSAQLHYNSNLVNPKDFGSYWDILNPKWKGKFLSLDPALSGVWGPLRLFYHHSEMGPGYLKKLFGEMEIKINRDDRLLTDWLANGLFALCLACKDTQRARSQGLPVDTFDTNGWKEGGVVTASPGALSLIDRAPHPNAAKVFINWFLSRDGQMAIQKFGDPADPPNSRRVDISKDQIPVHSRLVEGRKYFDVSHPSVSDMKPILQLVKEIVGQKGG